MIALRGGRDGRRVRAMGVALVALVVSSAAGCAQTVRVRTAGPHDRVVVDGRDLGRIPEDGADIRVWPGREPVPYEVIAGDEVVLGEVPRTEVVPWVIGAGVCGAACLAPALASVGFCVANPVAVASPVAFAATGDVGTLTASFRSPSWLTVPLVAVLGAVGLAPLGAVFYAETLPSEVLLQGPEVPLVLPPVNAGPEAPAPATPRASTPAAPAGGPAPPSRGRAPERADGSGRVEHPNPVPLPEEP